MARAYLTAEMRRQGIMSLRITDDWDAEQLQSAIRPDQSKWLPLWMSSLAGGSLRKLLRHFRCKEPSELLSVFVHHGRHFHHGAPHLV
eukprot:4713643-Lingulodinium_polyedra.AAC.1